VISENNHSWIDALRRAERLPENYSAAVSDFVVPLAYRVQALRAAMGRPVVIGINGAQGSGKSTFALFLTNWLERELGLTVASLSLDDLYLGKQARRDLSRQKHPLLRTRGVPGTHDVALGIETLAALTKPGPVRIVKVPVFDKAKDDLLDTSEWRGVDGPVDVVLFEGWCVGARPQPDESLNSPINVLEAEEDVGAAWRSLVNESLKTDYALLFERIDSLVMLRVPSFDKVIEWRGLQEQQLRERADKKDSGGATGMSPEEIRRFIMHFERLTRHMLEHMPSLADTVIDIDQSHHMVAMTHNDRPFERAPS